MATQLMNRSRLFAVLLPLMMSGCSDPQFAGSEPSQQSEAQQPLLNIVMMQPPRSGLSPLSDDAFKLSRWSTAETLVQLTPEGLASPMLATEWRQLSPTVWQFTLRPNVHFHNGQALTSDAVVNALQQALQAAPKPRILDGIHWQVQALDANTIEITSNSPDPLLPSRLSSPQLAILAPSAYQENGRVDPTQAGTGPFVLSQINGQTSATLHRFDGYWGEPAKIAGIFAEYVPNGFARGAALRTGQADVVEAVPVSQAALIDASYLHEVAMPRTNTLYLNQKSPVFSQLALRQAASQAINREQIINTVYEGRADLAQGLLGPALAWAAPLRAQQPSAQTLALHQAHGEHIVIGTFTDRAELPEVAVLLKQQLEQAGFNVTLDVREYAQIENDALAGKFDAFLLSRATVLDSGDPVAYMQSDFGCQGSFNLGQFCSEEVDEALQVASQYPLGSERQQAIIAAEQQILAAHAAIPLLHERVLQGERGTLLHVQRDPTERRLITEHTIRP